MWPLCYRPDGSLVAIVMTGPYCPRGCLRQQLEETEPVGVVTVNRFAVVAVGGDMVTGRSTRNGLAMRLIETRPDPKAKTRLSILEM